MIKPLPLPIANSRNAIEAKDTLYRCLDKRRAHKEPLFAHLYVG